MRVSELKDFLKRHDVDVASVKRSDGKAGQARKSDLLGAAMHVRADYEAPERNGPTSPDKNVQPNVFQSGYSPSRIPSNPAASAAAQSSPDSQASPQVPPPRRISRKKVRRSSVGWVNPAFLAQITPKKSPAASSQNKASPAASTPGTASKIHHDPEAYAQDFADPDDQVIQSDYDSTAGSGVESDSSVIETDDEDETSVNRFRIMKAYEVRAWLSKHNVPYNHRSKKAELISLASAHKMYLDTIAGGGEDDEGKENPDADGDEDEDAEDDEVEIVESGSSPPPTQRERRSARRPRVEASNSTEKKPSTDDIEPDTRASNQAQSALRPQRRRTITAPENEEDVVTAATPSKLNVTPGPASRPQAPQSAARPRRKRSPPPRAQFRVSMLLRDLFYYPPQKITRQSIKGMFVLMIICVSIVGLTHMARDWTKPFCDTNDIYGQYKGKECRPCPAHGICKNGELECEKLYRREGRICVEDSAVSKYATYLEKSMLKVLVEKKGARDCNSKELFEFDQNMLRDMFLESNLTSCPKGRLEHLNRRNLDVTKFSAAFEKAMSKLRDNREMVKIDKEGRFSAHEGRRTFSCSCKLFVWNNLWRCIGVALLLMLILRWKVRRFLRQRELARIEDVYNQALEVLRELRINYSEDDKGDAFMRDTELRVELLGRSTPESIQLWAKVEKLLQADTRVLRSGPRSINGHPCYVYEWRGNIRRSFSGSMSRDHGIRNYQQMDNQNEESRRRLSFGSSFRQQQPSPNAYNQTASPQHQPHTPAPAPYSASPQTRRNPVSPDPAPSPGYAKMLSLWRNH